MELTVNESTCRTMVRERSLGCCEMCGQPAAHMHHRRNRSQGGLWAPSNILHLCVQHHGFVTTEPQIAKRMGWTVRRISEPADVPVWRFDRTEGVRRLVKLTDDGGIHQQDPPLTPCPVWCQLDEGHDWEDLWRDGVVRTHLWTKRVNEHHAIKVQEYEQATADGTVRQREVLLDVETPTQWNLATAVDGHSALVEAVGILNCYQTIEDGQAH